MELVPRGREKTAVLWFGLHCQTFPPAMPPPTPFLLQPSSLYDFVDSLHFSLIYFPFRARHFSPGVMEYKPPSLLLFYFTRGT